MYSLAIHATTGISVTFALLGSELVIVSCAKVPPHISLVVCCAATKRPHVESCTEITIWFTKVWVQVRFCTCKSATTGSSYTVKSTTKSLY